MYWKQGRGVKAISHELGCSQASVSHHRAQLGLPPRHYRGKGSSPAVKMHVDMPKHFYDRVRQVASSQGYSASGFIRMVLIAEMKKLESHMEDTPCR